MRERTEETKDKLKGSLYDQYQVLDVIGSGTFGKVYLVFTISFRSKIRTPNSSTP
jgi:hypothetical protein